MKLVVYSMKPKISKNGMLIEEKGFFIDIEGLFRTQLHDLPQKMYCF